MKKIFTILGLFASFFAQSQTITVDYGSEPSACDTCTGLISLNISGGTAPYMVKWNDPSLPGSPFIQFICPGTYVATITDANGQTAVTPNIQVQSQGPVITGQVINPTCYGLCNGSVLLSVVGGSGGQGGTGYTYSWSTGVNGANSGTLCEGTYTVTVTDQEGCTNAQTFTLTPPSCLITSIATTNATCGANNGSVNLTVSGGVPSYFYTWSNGAITQDISNVSAGTYTVTVTDINGCTKTTSATINQASLMTLNTVVQNAVPPAANGAIDLTVTGGTPPYTFNWNNSPTAGGPEDLTGLQPGTYCVTVTDALGCTRTTCATVIYASNTPCSVTIISDPTGTLTAQPVGNTLNWLYSWSGPGGVIYTTPTIQVNNPGTYCVTVTAAPNICTATSCFTFGVPQYTITGVITNDDCGPDCTGAVDISITSQPGSGLQYTYLWNNGVTVSDISTLCGGEYTITVTGSDGTSSTKSFIIAGGNGQQVDLTITSSNPAYCNATSNLPNSTVCEKVCPDNTVTYGVDFPDNCTALPPSFTWMVTGAVSYTVSTDTKEVTVNWGGAGVGLVTVSASSAFSCYSGSLCVDITAEPKAKFTSNPVPDAGTGILQVCKGQNVWFQNQSIDAEQYEWQFSDNLSNTDEQNAEHTFNQPGTFTVLLIARTECLCADSAWLTVEVLDAVSPLLDCVSTICPGEQVTYTADASCGQYTWTVSANGTITDGGGAGDNSISVLWNGGTEGVISLNATACSGSTCPATSVTVVPILNDEAVIEGRERVCLNSEEVYKINLFKGSNYVWSIKPGSGTIIEGQGREKIIVQWSDTNNDTWVAVEYDNCYLGCTGRDTLPVRIRPPFTITGEVEKCLNSSGSFKTRTVPGAVLVTSQWQLYNPLGIPTGSIPNSNTANINFNSGDGTYRIFAVPTGAGLNNTCSDSADWKVRVKPNPPAPGGIAGPTIFCPGSPLTYTATGGSGLYNIKWEAKNTSGAPITDEGPSLLVTFSSGTPRWVSARQITTDGLACTSDSVMLQVTEMPPFQVTGTAGVCPGGSGTYNAPSFPGITYNWSVFPANAGVIKSGQNTNTVQVYWEEPGNHTIIADACGKNASLPVTVFTSPVPDPVYPAGICPGKTATLDANGFFNNYLWKKENGQVIANTYSTTVTTAGSYALIVTDANGCTGAKEFRFDDYPVPNVRISTIDPVDYCNEPISVLLTALTDADGNYQYQWFQDAAAIPVTTNNMTATAYGGYGVQVTNEYGCSDTDGVIQIFENCNPPGPGGSCNCNAQTCPGINFDVVPGASCDSFTFVTNMVIPYTPGSELWSIRRQGFGTLYGINAPSCGYRFPNAGQFVVQLSIELPDGSRCLIAKEVNVKAHAAFTVTPGCPGAPTLFTDETTFFPGAAAGSTWHWDFNDFASANTDTSSARNTSWAFSNPFIYNVQLTVTTATGCTTTATATVNVPDPPTLTFLPQTLSCAGNAIPMAVTVPGTVIRVDWIFDDPASGVLNQTTGTSVFHQYANQGSYTVSATATSISGCQAIFPFPVTITPNTLSGVISPAQTTICEGKSITLTAPPGGGGASYLWSTGANTTNITVNNGGTYSVTISTPNGCSYAPPAKTIDVNPAPDGSVNAVLYNDLNQVIGFVENMLEVCKGEDVYLEVKDNGSYQYAWSSGGGTGVELSFTEVRDNLLTVGTYNYAVTITNGTTGCTAVTPMFTVDVHPTPEGFSATANQFCAGTPSTVSYIGPQPADWLYFWNNGEVGTYFQTLDPGHFFVKVINQFGCKAESDRVTIHPGPNIAAIPGGCHTRCTPDTLCFAPMPEITSWQWYFEGSPIAGANTPDLVATQSGSYYVAVTDSSGCSAVSEPLDLTLFTGFGDILGNVWSDVNDNGIVDAGDTLMSQIPVLLWRNDTLLNNQQTASTGIFSFGNILATPYDVSVDSSALPVGWEIVIGAVSTELIGCDSKANVDLLLHIPVCQPVQNQLNVSVCQGTSYDHFGTLIPAGTSQQFTYSTLLGCDSLLTVGVQAFSTGISSRQEMVCAGGSFNFMGTDIPVGASQTFVLPNPVTGCDSFLTIQVEALPIATASRLEKVCPGGNYNFMGTDIPVGASQTFVLPNPLTGCDSMLTIQVEALPVATASRLEKICPGGNYNFMGTDIPVGASQTFVLPDPVTGCDSLLTIQVEALPVATASRVEKVCPGDSFNFMGTDIPAGTVQIFVLPHPVTGCDSMLTVQVDAFPVASSAFTTTVCEGTSLQYNGVMIPAGTTQDLMLTHPVTGCDSVVTVTVLAQALPVTDVSVDICPGTTFMYNGIPLTPGATYEYHFTTQQGECDSTVYVAVNARPSATFDLSSIKSCHNSPTGSIEIQNLAGGTAPFEIALNAAPWQNDLNFTNLEAGNYQIRVRDAHGCIFTDTTIITATAPLQVTLPEGLLIPCDTPMVEIKPLLSGDFTNLQFLWNNGSTTSAITAVDAGNITLEVKNQCESLTRSTAVSWAELPEDQDFVFVPNTVAPEAEVQANAIFKSFFVPEVEVLNFQMEVFDRWGDLIWRGFNVEDGWDTRDVIKKQNLAGAAVYVWWLTADINWCGRTVTIKRKGDVTVVR